MSATRLKLQFTLRDLMQISLLCGIGIFALSPSLLDFLAGFGDDFDDPALPLRIFCTFIIIVTTCLGGWLGIRRATRKQYSLQQRGLSILVYACIAWLAVILNVGPILRGRAPRITRNEKRAAEACRAFAEAEEIYHRTLHKNSNVLEYASTLADLYETAPGKADVKLIDQRMTAAEGTAGHAKPRAGYVFKVLAAQGSNATGGKKSYMSTGGDGKLHMQMGYALVASPVRYGIDGRHTFIISNLGTIYRIDLGPDTANAAASLEEFDPPTTPDTCWCE